MIKPIGLTHGHYECRSLKHTMPILTEILAFEKVGEGSNNVIMKHPNTGWLLVVHEGGPNAPDKPRLNHSVCALPPTGRSTILENFS